MLFDHLKSYLTWVETGSWYDEISSIIVPFGANSGPYDFTYTPYFKQFLEDLQNEDIEIISLMVPSQIGKTLLLISIGLIWAIKYSVPVYFYTASQSTADELMVNKVHPIVMANKKLLANISHDKNGEISRGAIKKNTINFSNGGSFNIMTIGSRQNLKGKTTSLVIYDEYAELVHASPKALGDPLERAQSRISEFTGYNRKILVASTPTFSDRDIDKLRSFSKPYLYLHTCSNPECKAEHEIRFEFIRLDGLTKTNSSVAEQKKAIEENNKLYWRCPSCNQTYYEYEKPDMLTRCKWVLQDNPDYDARYTCYSLQGVYGRRSWKDIYLQYLGAKEDPSKLRAFKNEALAEPWSLTKSETLKWDDLKKNLFPRKHPGDSKVIATGIDVQTSDKEIYYSVVGFGEESKYNLIDWGIRQYEDFSDLQTIVNELHNMTYGSMQNTHTFMDSGSYGDSVTKICMAISRDRCEAIKGSSSQRSIVYRFPDHNPRSIDTYRPINIHKTQTKAELDLYLQEGYIQFPADFDDAIYFQHLANEIPKTRGGKTDHELISSKAKIDYRDSLRYVVFAGNWKKITKTQSRLALFTKK